MYTKLSTSKSPTEKFDWDKKLITSRDKKISHKVIEGEQQVTYQITSTTFKKPESHKLQ
tara:strand:+ start:278 stop:454 length:177 start_codon:yes stop_codon:yes gene_type:complete